MFLGFDRLMQTVRIAAPFHHAAGKFVDNHHLAVLDDVVHVADLHFVRFQSVVNMLHQRYVGHVVKAAFLNLPGFLQQLFDVFHAGFGQGNAFGLFVLFIVGFRQLGDNAVDRHVFFRGILGRARDNQRRARLVDQNRVHLVDDRKIKRPLYHLGKRKLHVVAQIVKTQLVVGAVNNVAGIGGTAFLVVFAVYDVVDRQPQKTIYLPHPLGVAFSQIVVDGNDMHAFAFQGVKISGERGDQRFAFAGFHFGDHTLVQNDAADQLHVIMSLAERSSGSLAHHGKSFRQQVVKSFPLFQALAELRRFRLQLFVAEFNRLRFQRVDLVDCFILLFDKAVIGAAKEHLCNFAYHKLFHLDNI